jgi:hypothetical protein
LVDTGGAAQSQNQDVSQQSAIVQGDGLSRSETDAGTVKIPHAPGIVGKCGCDIGGDVSEVREFPVASRIVLPFALKIPTVSSV